MAAGTPARQRLVSHRPEPEIGESVKKKTFAALALTALAVPGVASAAPPDAVTCRQDVRAALLSTSDEGTWGDYMSDGLFGNEPNIEGPVVEDAGPNELEPGTAAGRVVPSLTPGPETKGGGFYTGGQLQADIAGYCNA